MCNINWKTDVKCFIQGSQLKYARILLEKVQKEIREIIHNHDIYISRVVPYKSYLSVSFTMFYNQKNFRI